MYFCICHIFPLPHVFGILMSSTVNYFCVLSSNGHSKRRKVGFQQRRSGNCQQSCQSVTAVIRGIRCGLTQQQLKQTLQLPYAEQTSTASSHSAISSQVPAKELAWGGRPCIALQITCTSPSLAKHDFQLELEDEYLHLMTDFLTPGL